MVARRRHAWRADQRKEHAKVDSTAIFCTKARMLSAGVPEEIRTPDVRIRH